MSAIRPFTGCQSNVKPPSKHTPSQDERGDTAISVSIQALTVSQSAAMESVMFCWTTYVVYGSFLAVLSWSVYLVVVLKTVVIFAIDLDTWQMFSCDGCSLTLILHPAICHFVSSVYRITLGKSAPSSLSRSPRMSRVAPKDTPLYDLPLNKEPTAQLTSLTTPSLVAAAFTYARISSCKKRMGFKL